MESKCFEHRREAEAEIEKEMTREVVPMLSDADAAIIGAVIGGVIGSVSGLGSVWLASYFARRDSGAERRAEKLFAVYVATEYLSNLLTAVQKQQIERKFFHREWAKTTEKIIGALIGSELDRKRILTAINGKWDDPNSVTVLRKLADELLEKLDPEYARASREMLKEFGITREDIEPTVP